MNIIVCIQTFFFKQLPRRTEDHMNPLGYTDIFKLDLPLLISKISFNIASLRIVVKNAISLFPTQKKRSQGT